MAIKTSNQITFTEQKKIIEIQEWYLATSRNSGVTVDMEGWTIEVQTINEATPYLWNYEKVIYSIGDPEISEPAVIGFYGKGADGRSIVDVKNYYQITTDTNPPTSWLESVPMLDPVNKYLWNYEIITYTIGDPTETEPAIIGVYGDSGTDAVDFQIYSVDGFEFKEGVNSIELKTVASQKGKLIESNATYQWKYWNAESDLYEEISNATSSALVVTKTDVYAFSSIKCEMTYDGIIYEDYVTLSEKNVIYTSTIKFFDGSNIFDQDKPYLILYIELYKNNQLEETIKTNQYYYGNNSIDDSGNIQTDVEGTFENNDLAYFIYKNTNGNYSVVLGQYLDGSWTVYDASNKCVYINDIYDDITSNVVAISKEDVSKNREINVKIYRDEKDSDGISIYNNTTFLSQTNAVVTDLNDPIISDTEPFNAKYGQLWLDTSSDPYILKIYTKKNATYTLGDIQEVVLSKLTSNTAKREIEYSPSVDVSDDGKVALSSPVSSTYASYGSSNATDVLRGNFCLPKDSKIIYYVEGDSSFKTATELGSATRYYERIATKMRQVTGEASYSSWEYFSQQNGGEIYTSQPSKYSAGDLWILADNETCKNFGPGTMLKAIRTSAVFNEDDWTDAMEEVTTTIANIKESFYWDDTGIKVMRRVTDSDGNVTNPFYVHIDSTRMGFHSVEYENGAVKNDVEVVHIGINSATIQNATFEGENGTTFENNANFKNQIQFGNFIWKVESNGSLSLAIID